MKIAALLVCLIAAPLAGPLAASPAAAQEAPSLADLGFLEGRWTGESDDLYFEEIWAPARAGVMTAMARGAKGDALSVVEYIVVAAEEDGVFMRFKHFRADYSTWEDAGPAVLRFMQAMQGDVIFHNDNPAAEVQSVRYLLKPGGGLQAEIELLQDGETGGFSLSFDKVSD